MTLLDKIQNTPRQLTHKLKHVVIASILPFVFGGCFGNASGGGGNRAPEITVVPSTCVEVDEEKYVEVFFKVKDDGGYFQVNGSADSNAIGSYFEFVGIENDAAVYKWWWTPDSGQGGSPYNSYYVDFWAIDGNGAESSVNVEVQVADTIP